MTQSVRFTTILGPVKAAVCVLALVTVGCFQGSESSVPPTAAPTAEPRTASGQTDPQSPTAHPSEARAIAVIRTRIADRDRRHTGSPQPTPSPTPRADASFLPNGVVAAPSIGLMWTPQAVGAFGYDDAVRYCRGLDLAGFDDWSLPTIHDLEGAMGADVVVSIPDNARALWTGTPADHRGHITVDLATNSRSTMDAGLAHVLCVRKIPLRQD